MTTIEQWVQERSGTWGQTAQEALSALGAVAELTRRVLNSDHMSLDEQDASRWVREEIEEALGINGLDDTK